MKYIIKKDLWKVKYSEDIYIDEDKLIIKNNTNDKIKIEYSNKIHIEDKTVSSVYVNAKGIAENSGGYLTFNDDYSFPINSEITMPIVAPTNLKVSLTVSANSMISIGDIIIDTENDVSLVNTLSSEHDVLVLVPDYPSYVNLYSCAFAHSRNKEYVKENLKVQVFVVNPYIWFQTKYIKDGLDVMRGTYKDLKELLAKHQYRTIVTHFVDEHLFPIFDGNIFENQKLIFICHGPETVYKYLVNKTRPYFTSPCNEVLCNSLYELKDSYVKKYAEKDNVEWVFVSEWLKNFSEEKQGLKFKHCQVINNIIDEELFPYTKRTAEQRKKILVVRKFDNICQHSIDQIVLALLELSHREIFNDLEFSIYGDGNFYETLVEPIKDFKNVRLIRSFIPNEKLNDIYKEYGIILLPSRHDAHAVSMGESASTGMVVIGSNVTSNPYFMNEKENHTLSNPEDYVALADIIERLYNNPDEFLKISKNMATFTRQFSKANTVYKEIELINKSNIEYSKKKSFVVHKPQKPVLTIGVPSYNVEKYLEKCLVSILNARNSSKIEVLVINDGSSDDTAQIAERISKESNGIVRLINKENGGHGSTINLAIQEAKGKYFRLIDADDWVDSENLAKLVDIMETEDTDVILTKGCYDYVEESQLVNIINYDHMLEGKKYRFEDLTYPGFGFEKYGPLLTTGNYKTELLRKANFKISEKKPYVDMEFNAFSIKCVETITYYNLDIYRYLIGREGQTVSKEFWKKKYKDHEYVIFNILEKIVNNDEYSKRKIEYCLNSIISPMVDSQIFMFDAICRWDEIDPFLDKLRSYPNVYDKCLKYINKLGGNSQLILSCYHKFMKSNSKESIIIPGYRESINDNSVKSSKTKKVVKAIIPYGLIVLMRRYRNQNH